MDNENTNDSILKLEEIMQYYYKGFGTSIMGANDSIEAFTHFNGGDKYKKIFQNIVIPLLSHYDSIPFDNLYEKKDFYSLFIVDELLLKYYARAENYFENPNFSEGKEILGLGKSIIKAGYPYQELLDKTLFKVREDTKYKNFVLKVFDDKGDIFEF